MANNIHCDRCGNITTFGGHRELGWAKLTIETGNPPTRFFTDLEHKYREQDLCRECLEALIDFMSVHKAGGAA